VPTDHTSPVGRATRSKKKELVYKSDPEEDSKKRKKKDIKK